MSITIDDDKNFTVDIPIEEGIATSRGMSYEFKFTEKGLEQGVDCLPWSYIRIARMMIDGPKMEGEATQFVFNISSGKESTVNLIQLMSQCIAEYPDTDIAAVLAYFNQLYGVKK